MPSTKLSICDVPVILIAMLSISCMIVCVTVASVNVDAVVANFKVIIVNGKIGVAVSIVDAFITIGA